MTMGDGQVEGVNLFETLPPSTWAASNRRVAAAAVKLDWGLRRLNTDQAYVQ